MSGRALRRLGLRLRLRQAAIIGPVALLFTAGAALATNSPPTPRGQYVGETSQRFPVNVRVSSNGREFQSGKLLFYLHGPKSCRGRGTFDLSPTPPPAIKISRIGRISFRGTFVVTPTRGLPFKGKGTVVLVGEFSQHGKLLTGSAKEKLFNSHGSCSSGLITFKATRRG